MKKLIYGLAIFMLGIALGYFFSPKRWKKSEEVKPENTAIETDASSVDQAAIPEEVLAGENFDDFFYEFMLNPEFQLSRTRFPLAYLELLDEGPGNETDTTFLTAESWQHNSFYLDRNTIPVVYDNFEMTARDTDERVFVWSGIENGIHINYFFKRENQLWYLLKVENWST